VRDRPCLLPRITSFYTFFEDTIYLEIGHKSLRCLLGDRRSYRESFWAALASCLLAMRVTSEVPTYSCGCTQCVTSQNCQTLPQASRGKARVERAHRKPVFRSADNRLSPALQKTCVSGLDYHRAERGSRTFSQHQQRLVLPLML